MDKKNKSKRFLVAAMILLAVILLGTVLMIVTRQVINLKRTQHISPSVQINAPQAGETIPAGSSLVVSASSFGSSPITIMQFWLDGQLVDQKANSSASAGVFSEQIAITLSEGPHMLLVRVVDQQRLVGQSLPIPLYGSAELADAAGLMVVAAEGDTLEDIASRFGISPNTLQTLNPGLASGGLASGTEIQIPIDKAGEDSQKPTTADVIQPQTLQTSQAVLLPAVISPNPLADAWNSLVSMRPPQAPSGLVVLPEKKACKLNLYWLDNSTNEEYFRVWMAGLGVPARVIQTVSSSQHTGPVWYQFDIPQAGIYSFWVEAFNGLGAQPGETVWSGIPATQCESYTATSLQLEIQEITFYGFYERLYSYISVEGAPERRFPAHDGEFWFGALNAERTTIYPLERNILSIPIPEDDELNLEGKSMGWMGGVLNDLGPFSSLLPSTAWDGSQQVIQTPNYRIVYTVQPFGSMQAQGSYTFYDLSLPAPFNLQDRPQKSIFLPMGRLLSWEWLGDEKDITGFTIFLNNQPFKTALPNQRQLFYLPASQCGGKQVFQVAVNTAHGQSELSAPLEYNLPPCPILAEVQFVSFTPSMTQDSFRGKCDQIETYYEFWVSGATEVRKKVWGKPFFFPVTCQNAFTFDDVIYGFTKHRGMDRIVVPIDPTDPKLVIGLFAWDYDWGSQDDAFIMIKESIDKPIQDWLGYEEEFRLRSLCDAGYTESLIRVRGIPAEGQ